MTNTTIQALSNQLDFTMIATKRNVKVRVGRKGVGWGLGQKLNNTCNKISNVLFAATLMKALLPSYGFIGGHLVKLPRYSKEKLF